MSDEQGSNDGDPPDSLLPYETWTEDAFRGVAVRALEFVVANGLPGDHHFYITFRTDHGGTVLPARLRAKYPEEMTIVLQHKFWDLTVNHDLRNMSVGLSFGGVSSILVIPFDAITGFADPSVRWGLRFRPVMPDAAVAPLRPGQEVVHKGLRSVTDATPARAEGDATPEADAKPQVVSLDAFRKRKD